MVQISREKAVYHVMNKANYDKGRKCMIAEGWCPQTSIETVQVLFHSLFTSPIIISIYRHRCLFPSLCLRRLCQALRYALPDTLHDLALLRPPTQYHDFCEALYMSSIWNTLISRVSLLLLFNLTGSQEALVEGRRRSDVMVPSVLSIIETTECPPTYFKTNKVFLPRYSFFRAPSMLFLTV